MRKQKATADDKKEGGQNGSGLYKKKHIVHP